MDSLSNYDAKMQAISNYKTFSLSTKLSKKIEKSLSLWSYYKFEDYSIKALLFSLKILNETTFKLTIILTT